VFRGIVVPSPATEFCLECLTPKMAALRLIETSGIIYPATQLNTSEHLKLPPGDTLFAVVDRNITSFYATFKPLLPPTALQARRFADSIPGGTSEIFYRLNPSVRTMILRSSQPLTEMSTRIVSWGLKRPVL